MPGGLEYFSISPSKEAGEAENNLRKLLLTASQLALEADFWLGPALSRMYVRLMVGFFICRMGPITAPSVVVASEKE